MCMLEIMYAPWFMCVRLSVCQRDRVCTTEFVCQTTNYCTNVLRADLGNVMLKIFWGWGVGKYCKKHFTHQDLHVICPLFRRFS